MKMRNLALLPLLACGLLAVSGDAIAAEKRLDSAMIRDRMVGRTVTIVSPTRKLSGIHLETGGAIRGVRVNAKAPARWSVKNNALCLEIADTEAHGCLKVIQRGDDKSRLFLFTPAGRPVGVMIVGTTRS